MDTSMKGKTVLFTGASRGMGRFAAIELARRGAEILVVGHHEARGADAVEAIRGTGGSAEFLRADMGDAAEVCALADAVLARSGSIDVLIHSAGGMPPAGAITREGVDRGFAQNFLGAFLLTRLLEERLLESAPARVIAVGSGAHKLLKSVDIDVLMRPGKALSQMGSYQRGGYQRGSYQMLSYQTAKLAVTTWMYGLARRWEQYVRLASDPALASVSGMYFVSGKEKKESSSPLTLDPAVQKRIDDVAEAWAAPFLRARAR